MPQVRKSEEISGWLFMLPFAISMMLFFVYAIVRTAYFSVTDFDLFQAPTFVGLSNYLTLLSDPLFLTALGNTIGFSLVVTTAQTILALLLSVLVNQAVRGKGFVRTVFYLPCIMSSAAMTLIFLWLFQRDGLITGFVQFLVNYRLYVLLFLACLAFAQGALVLNASRKYDGISNVDPFFLLIALTVAIGATILSAFWQPLPIYEETFLISWLNTQQRFLFMPTTLWSVAMMNIFTTMPTLMLLFLAGLQSIPHALYEAAEIDGANAFQRFRYITVPALRPVTFAVVTMGIIGTLQMFDQVAILGDAAPLSSRITLAYYIFENAFPAGASSRIGVASAAALILGALTIAVVYVQKIIGVKERLD
ncbi:sugar ABC transporter permease [Sinorhizobium numidicum]|uniref:Sugar ABC transporter permease n=1 Tax=Sinorhizobium numidicum TaxID=680248 RepID=A0ABY8CNW8_9HYPH|nr:sugar ABC transporter permease [Sinorhizobium numidicum]WEX74367.1 sugar ABC transporter permease [Sinorhizobium numidicum]WEX80354.1 sugar ABC transporter permease [Sinorhizobium numidicum]